MVEPIPINAEVDEPTTNLTSTYWLVEEAGVGYVTKPNQVLDKAVAFAVRIINLHKWLRKEHPTIGALSTQILKAGTSIGANINEADCAFSKREFASKLGISLKEARETNYWLGLLKATDYIDEPMYASLSRDCGELIRLLVSILKSTRANLTKQQ
ncbi:four helix bundle protein [Fibrella aestuarina]|uniref:four helix bundle protein n=1 Tax=Fibrella aestuarina TaxID=651143 RepID=UPI000A018ABF|nr:four helix bundle protein [Fibrella aestuarina]